MVWMHTGSRRQHLSLFLTRLKPALIKGITDASSLSGLKNRMHQHKKIFFFFYFFLLNPMFFLWFCQWLSSLSCLTRTRKEETSFIYLFTTATITVFSAKLTALIDLNGNRGSPFEKHMASNQCVFHFPRSDSPKFRQSPAVELCERD